MGFSRGHASKQEVQASAHEHLQAQGMLALKDLFKPELLNRVDEIVVFHRLEQEHLREIVDLMIGQTQERLAEQSIEL